MVRTIFHFPCFSFDFAHLSGHPSVDNRQILLYPFGNSAPTKDVVSVYLDYVEPNKAPKGWHACVQFALVISNTRDPTIYTVSRGCQCWSQGMFLKPTIFYRCTSSLYC